MKPKITKKKFYNKWLYKISLTIKEAYRLRYNGSKTLEGDILKVFNYFEKIPTDRYFRRIESNTIDLYFNDIDLYHTCSEEFEKNIKARYEPSIHVSNSDDVKIIFVKDYPHKKYQYKVYLRPHKFKKKDDKISFLNWLDSQSPRISITESTKTWFINTSWNWDRRYMYVEDDQTLFLCKLRSSDAVGSVYSYVVVDK
jgi:hypothetical protein